MVIAHRSVRNKSEWGPISLPTAYCAVHALHGHQVTKCCYTAGCFYGSPKKINQELCQMTEEWYESLSI